MATKIYKDNFGKRLPSVTGILGRFKESGGLLHWANAQGLEGKTLDDARQEVATPGTVAHEMVEAHLRGELGDDASKIVGWKLYPDPIWQSAKRSYAAYLTWEQMNRITFRHAEVALVSKKHAFGGTLDAIGIDHDNRLCLLDWKAANSVYADYLYQMAAYAMLWKENYPEHELSGGFHLCRFAKEQGDYSHHFYPNLDPEAETFLLMRSLYDRVKLTEKRVR